ADAEPDVQARSDEASAEDPDRRPAIPRRGRRRRRRGGLDHVTAVGGLLLRTRQVRRLDLDAQCGADVYRPNAVRLTVRPVDVDAVEARPAPPLPLVALRPV